LEAMKNIPNKSIDMILCDLPYGTTQNEWDSTIPVNKLWKEYERIINLSGWKLKNSFIIYLHSSLSRVVCVLEVKK